MKNNKALTKSQLAYKKLHEMIIQGKFSPDNNWSLRKLAKKLKMSVVPISEAIRRLEQQGIIEVKPQRGIIVRQLTPNELEQLKIIREGLEVQAIRMLAISANKKQISILKEMAKKLRTLLKQKKYAQAAYLDFQLHRKIIEFAEIDEITQRYDQLSTLCMLNTEGKGPSWLHHEYQTGNPNHIILIEAIESADPQKADIAIRAHINTVVDKANAKI